jgi:hypothetical protein
MVTILVSEGGAERARQLGRHVTLAFAASLEKFAGGRHPDSPTSRFFVEASDRSV